MKRLLLFLLLLPLLPLQAEAAVAWQSYSDSAGTVQCDYFNAPDCFVYMKGTGLQNNKAYRATYYDSDGDTVLIYNGQSSSSGVFLSQVKPSACPNSSPGVWSVKLERITGGVQLIATDTFTVTPQAIPEIPMVAGGAILALSCALIYSKVKERLW